jgi:PhnB protein
MPKPSLNQQLDAAIEAMLAERNQSLSTDELADREAERFYGPSRKQQAAGAAPEADAPERIGPLLAIARDLADLPRDEFRSNLRDELKRRAVMESAAGTALGKVPPVPEGHHTVSPYLAVRNAAGAIEFYKNAFGATELMRMTAADGKIGHAEVQIGDSRIMLSDEFPDYGAVSPETAGGTPVSIHLYVESVDSMLARAANAGATITSQATDYPYGERQANLRDPFGHSWTLATFTEQVSAEEYQRREALQRQPGAQAGERESKAAEQPGRHVRPGFHTAVPYLTVSDGLSAIEFYKKAFGATEIEAMRYVDPEGRLAHGEVTIGDSGVMLNGESEGWNHRSPRQFSGTPVKIHLYVPDVDQVAAQAIEAGAKVIRPVQDQFYGERSGQIEDPFGHCWFIASQIEHVTPEEVERRAAAFIAERTRQADQAKAQAAGGSIPGMRGGFTAITPYITIARAEELVDFVKSAFGATEISRGAGSAGGTHFEIRIGNSMVMIGGMPGILPEDERPGAFHYYVEDTDAVYQRALDAGATSIQPPADQPYGERGASVKDAFGNNWYIATAHGGHYIREGFRSLTPYLHPASAAKLIDFLKQAFAAAEIGRHADPTGRIAHAEVRIGGAVLEMGEAHGPYQSMSTAIYLYVPDVDAAYGRAIEAGAASVLPPTDQPYGDRNAWVSDSSGVTWYIATPIAGFQQQSQ